MKRFLSILAVLALCASFCPARAQSSDQKNKLQKEIELLDRQIRNNNAASRNALTELELTQSKLKASRKLVSESNREISSINSRISAKERAIKDAQVRLDTMEVYYARLVRSAYKNRDSRIWYMYLLSGKNLAQNLRRFNYLRNLSETLRGQATRIQEEKQRLELEKAELVALKNDARKLLNQRTADLNALKKTESREKEVIAKLNKEKTKYQKELDTKRQQAEQLRTRTESFVRDNTPAKTTLSKSSPDYKLSSAFAAAKGRLPWPVEGVVVEHYGQHYHPVYKKVKLPFNNGVNIATAPGAKVSAVYEGTVKQVVVMPGYNQCVLVQHGEFFTFYCKLASVNVKAGDKIKAGALVGKVDTISGTTQLHFQLWQGKKAQNPENWLSAR